MATHQFRLLVLERGKKVEAALVDSSFVIVANGLAAEEGLESAAFTEALSALRRAKRRHNAPRKPARPSL